MPAPYLQDEAIETAAARMDARTLAVLRRLRRNGFINGAADEGTAATLARLTEDKLVDPGYSGRPDGKPFIWVINGNGQRVLSHFDNILDHKLQIRPWVRSALDSLSEDEREAVLATAGVLATRDPESWPSEQAIRLSLNEPAYLVRVPPDLRVLVRVVAPGEFELFDMVREETLRVIRDHHVAASETG